MHQYLLCFESADLYCGACKLILLNSVKGTNNLQLENESEETVVSYVHLLENDSFNLFLFNWSGPVAHGSKSQPPQKHQNLITSFKNL